MRYPCDGIITQGFHSAHQAIDMAFPGGANASYGKPIYAPEGGTVTHVGQMGAVGTQVDAGTVVQITNGNRVHRVCHLIPGSPTVSVGQNVHEGQVVGQMGWSGYVLPANRDGTHTHWVFQVDGVRLDGSKYVTNTAGGNAVDTIKSMYWRLLGRNADQDGINTYVKAANERGWEFVYNDLKNSAEGQNDWNRRNPDRVNALEAGIGERDRVIADLRTALANEQGKPPVEVIKEVEKIVEVPVEVIKEVPVYTHDQETKDMVTSIYNYFKGQYQTFLKYVKK
jgi:hypothetical protein